MAAKRTTLRTRHRVRALWQVRADPAGEGLGDAGPGLLATAVGAGGLGLLIGAVVGIPLAVFVVYKVYS